MEIKIGIVNVAREVSIESSLTSEEVTKVLGEALASGGLVELDDDKGRRIIVPASQVGYVELGPENQRRVGFGSV
ncbi:DUF3107 domain-containing protein [Propionibacteriaceae bacterium G1746]|uniref:DUF3107 domain-containing protein n=1 Tax=Aestuariimicrobium sp. G57 TaxID=3418485 RepID=UPI003C1CF130